MALLVDRVGGVLDDEALAAAWERADLAPDDTPDDSWHVEDFFDCYICQGGVGIQFCEACQIDYCSHPYCLGVHERMHSESVGGMNLLAPPRAGGSAVSR